MFACAKGEGGFAGYCTCLLQENTFHGAADKLRIQLGDKGVKLKECELKNVLPLLIGKLCYYGATISNAFIINLS